MKVKILESISTPATSYDIGKEYDLDDDLAKQWIASGICKAVMTAPVVKKITKKGK